MMRAYDTEDERAVSLGRGETEGAVPASLREIENVLASLDDVVAKLTARLSAAMPQELRGARAETELRKVSTGSSPLAMSLAEIAARLTHLRGQLADLARDVEL